MGLDQAGITYDPRTGVTVDDSLQTSNRRVFAAGDVTSLGPKFTHAADAMARVALRNALFPGRARVSVQTIPRCTFTDPEVATLGLTIQAADAQGLRWDLYSINPEGQPDRVATDGGLIGVRLLTRRGTNDIIGATVAGNHAGEIIGTLSLAMRHRLTLRQIADTVFPYPTYTEAIKKVADQYNRTRLTPFRARVLKTWLRWFR
jgi:pyruvate/2-oxoglutarate dehydrogenase complex dihydrolipoamide dehydrogenase (E3) component